MGKVLIEKIESTPLTYQADKNNKFLGFLEGISANSNEKTRNGRRYPIELWRNVESSPEFIEAMKTQTCFGECDHPFDDRVDTSIKEVAIVLIKFEIRNDGTVFCKFGILDTPNGRLLKSILDSGCRIGVSSRGVGEEITRNGETIIDPDTYVFYGFDAVVMPAVVSARPVMTEANCNSSNLGIKALTESFNREINSASSVVELESIMKLADKINLPDKDSIKESINIKLENLSNGENISSKLESDLGNLAQENEDLKSKVAELESIISAKNIRINENMKAIHSMRDNSRDLCRIIRESKVKESHLNETISRNDSIISRLNESMNSGYSRQRKLHKKVNEVMSSNDMLRESLSKKDKEIDRLKSTCESLNNSISRTRASNRRIIEAKDSEIERLRNTCESLNDSISRNSVSNKRIIESKDSEITRMKSMLSESKNKITTINSKCNEMNSRLTSTVYKYLETRCLHENLDINSLLEILPKNYSVSDVDKKITELVNRRDRLNKVPVNIPPRKAIVTESCYSNDPEYLSEVQTVSILSNMNK